MNFANLNQFYKKFGSQMSAFWSQLSIAKRMTLGGIIALVGFATVALFATQKNDAYEYVFVDMSPEDVQAIASHLRTLDVLDYLIDSKGIKVPTKDVLQLRMKLSQEGLPTHGQVGWEKFDSQDFARTDFEQQINRLRAIQGELSRTIMSIEGITGARVHIVSPKQSVFVEDQKEATAAVYIKTKRGVKLDDRQIKGMQHLVSRSVEGLKPQNITILDQEGKMLTKIESEDLASKMSTTMLAFKQQIEKETEEKIRTIVARVVGPDRVEVRVDATVDFTQEEQTRSDVDPEKSAVLSKHTTDDSVSGTGLNPTGIPGAKSNVPGEAEAISQAGSSSNQKKNSEHLNYEVTKTVSKKTLPVGNIVRLTAAVLVDGRQEQPLDGSRPIFEPRPEDDMKKIEELVKKAMGYKEGRDDVQVQNLMFQLDPVQIQNIAQEKKENREYLSTLAVSAAIAIALVLFFAFIVRPYFRWLSYDPERKKEQTIIEEFRPDLEISGVQNVQVKEEVPFEKMTQQEQILFIAKNEPKRTTEALRMLLNPHQTAH